MSEAMRIGIIGCDTSHVTAFTKVLHDESEPYHVAGGRVVAAYPSFSRDVANSKNRVEGFTSELRENWQVNICQSVEEVLEQVDVVLLESVDGRRHLAELRPVVEAGKPVFVDKPFAANLADAKEMVRLLNEAGVGCFSSSALRFDPNVKALLDQMQPGEILACDAFGPAPLEPTNPGLFWYGIHGVEMLYTLMGAGCKSVCCTSTDDYDLVVGCWGDRIGTVRGVRAGKSDYEATVFCEGGVHHVARNREVPIYAGLLAQIMEFFRTGRAPVGLDETLEIMAFMEAALVSSQNGGRPVDLGGMLAEM